MNLIRHQMIINRRACKRKKLIRVWKLQMRLMQIVIKSQNYMQKFIKSIIIHNHFNQLTISFPSSIYLKITSSKLCIKTTKCVYKYKGKRKTRKFYSSATFIWETEHISQTLSITAIEDKYSDLATLKTQDIKGKKNLY